METSDDEIIDIYRGLWKIDFSKRIRSLGEIKKILAGTKKAEKHHENLTNEQARNPAYLLALRAFFQSFYCKSQEEQTLQ